MLFSIYRLSKKISRKESWRQKSGLVRSRGRLTWHSNMQRIPDDSSIFTAEAKAVDLALDFISTCAANNKFIIFSDSLSLLKAMSHTSLKNPHIQKL